MMTKVSCCYLVFVLTALFSVSVRLSDAQVCYAMYRPANRFSMNQGQCHYPIGGVQRMRGVFIKSYMSCCRRPRAQGWGYPFSCKPCAAIRGVLSDWSQWSTCSRTCGVGRQTRERLCSTFVCPGMRGRRQMESRSCSWHSCCPVDGGWSQWSPSTGCSVSCGHGFEYRIRSCSQPKTECGGRTCPGIGKQFKNCFINCATWGQWAAQAPCSASCGNGTVVRKRICQRPMGGVCPGPFEDVIPCSNGPCPRNGEFCPWSPWQSCTSNCTELEGTMKRSRSCSCPQPEPGGQPCQGSATEEQPCRGKKKCSVDGGWGAWTSWENCSAITCSVRPGLRHRIRLCNDPRPYLNGSDCVGDAREEQSCLVMDNCFVKGSEGTWSEWSSCSETCGSCGRQTRRRRCISPMEKPEAWRVQAVIGTPRLWCSGSLNESRDCRPTVACPGGVDRCAPTTSKLEAATMIKGSALREEVATTPATKRFDQTLPGESELVSAEESAGERDEDIGQVLTRLVMNVLSAGEKKQVVGKVDDESGTTGYDRSLTGDDLILFESDPEKFLANYFRSSVRVTREEPLQGAVYEATEEEYGGYEYEMGSSGDERDYSEHYDEDYHSENSLDSDNPDSLEFESYESSYVEPTYSSGGHGLAEKLNEYDFVPEEERSKSRNGNVAAEFLVDRFDTDGTELNCMDRTRDETDLHMNECCLILSKNETNSTDLEAERYDKCLSLQMKSLFGYEDDHDLTESNGIEVRQSVRKKRCPCRHRKKLMLTFCCQRRRCDEWRNKLLQSTCKVCRPFCPPCFSKILYG